MPENNIDPILLKIIRSRMGRPTNTVGARALQELNIPRSMSPMVGGGNRMPGFNPSQMPVKPTAPSVQDIMARYPKPTAPAGLGPQPDVNIPVPQQKPSAKTKMDAKIAQNPAITPYLNMLDQEGIPYSVHVSPAHNSAYITYGPKGNEKIFTLRVPHPDSPHAGRPKNEGEIKRFIDTAGTETIPRNAVRMEIGALKNAAGESFSDIDKVREAVKWQMGRLTEPGKEPFVHGGQWMPPPEKGPAQLPKQPPNMQKQFMTQMMHNDEKPKMPTIMGGDPNNALSSQSLNQRFYLVTPKDLGEYGAKTYDPMTDPNYQALLKILGRPGVNTGNDR